MAGASASINDRKPDLLWKIAWNWYQRAITAGATGLNPPNINDNSFVLIKKSCYYTAIVADTY